MKDMKIQRHNLAMRFTHWTAALAIFILIFSGFGQMPVYQRYFVDRLPGLGWASNYSITLQLHYIGALLLLFISAYYLTCVIYNRSFDLWPRRGDVRETLQILLALAGIGEEPPQHKYLAEQRIAFLVTAVSVAALIITGMIKVYKNIPDNYLAPDAIFWSAQVHNLFTVILLFSVIFHVGAFFIKANRPLLPGMFSGWVDAGYIKRRHRLWYAALELEHTAAAGVQDTIAAGAIYQNDQDQIDGELGKERVLPEPEMDEGKKNLSEMDALSQERIEEEAVPHERAESVEKPGLKEG